MSASACPSGYLCGWSGTDATGSMMKTRTDMPTMGTWDNRIRSYWNRTSSVSCLYSDPSTAAPTSPTRRTTACPATTRASTRRSAPSSSFPTSGSAWVRPTPSGTRSPLRAPPDSAT
ncbi:peptidase inhibitor family I36 protein [Streptomyces sp. Y2F8-2]|uniref:peptidase inhibitor family I36 protein n=1 Tax=Streptomyces sp. Y2F8-2 TaxID=2759675 RepID=UPI0035B52F24